MPNDQPTVDNPLHIGAHRFYVHHGAVPVVVYHGDAAPSDVAAITARVGDYSPRVVIVDVSDLGAYDLAARKELIKRSAEGESGAVDITIYICGADVVRRALMTLAATAARVMSKHRLVILHRKRLEDALADVDALLERA